MIVMLGCITATCQGHLRLVRESGRSLQLTSLDPETEQEVKTGVWGAWSMKRPLWRKDDWTQDGGCGHLSRAHDTGATEIQAIAVIPDWGTNRDHS